MYQFLFRWLIAGCFSVTAAHFTNPAGESTAEPPAVLESEPAQAALNAASLPASNPRTQLPAAIPPVAEAKKTSMALVSQVPAAAGASGGPTVRGDDNPAVRSSAASGTVEYIIQPDDVLQITVYEEPDLSTKSRVAGSGEINFPLLGRVQAAGRSVIQLQEKLEALLEEDYLVNPQVQVFIDTFHARNVFVTGAVNKPGSYPLPTGKPTTLMEAIAMAGGFDEEAAVNGTRIIRIENGKETTLRVQVNDIIKKGDKTKDVEVRPNDVIFVPESFF